MIDTPICGWSTTQVKVSPFQGNEPMIDETLWLW